MIGGFIALGGLLGIAIVPIVIVEQLLRSRDIDHAKCMSHIAHYTGNAFAAAVLKAAADDYASAEGQHEVAVIIHSGEFGDHDPIPAVWLRARADKLLDEVGL